MGGPRVQDDADSDTMLKDAKVNFIVPSLRTKKVTQISSIPVL